MAAAVHDVEAAHGSVGTLVNNAGYGEYGTVEETDLDKVRAMFETNVFGLARMCQLVLPGMRAAGTGRIVNIGSMGGRLRLPGRRLLPRDQVRRGGHSPTPCAWRSAAFGIHVSLVEPGVIRSEFVEKSTDSEGMGGRPDSPYAAMRASVSTSNNQAYSNRMMSASAESVAEVVASAVAADRPRTRYLLTPAAKVMAATRTVAGDRVWDRLMARQFSL